MTDNEEVNIYNTDPTDADSDDDGLSDYEEVITFGTNPNNTDSDNDLVSDNDEINTHKTDPNSTDSDNDSISDYEELELSLDPLNSDTDNDGLSDGQEQTLDRMQISFDPLVSDASINVAALETMIKNNPALLQITNSVVKLISETSSEISVRIRSLDALEGGNATTNWMMHNMQMPDDVDFIRIRKIK